MVHCVVKDSLSQCGFYPEDLFKIISYQVSIFHCELMRGVWFNHQPVNFFHRLLGGYIDFWGSYLQLRVEFSQLRNCVTLLAHKHLFGIITLQEAFDFNFKLIK